MRFKKSFFTITRLMMILTVSLGMPMMHASSQKQTHEEQIRESIAPYLREMLMVGFEGKTPSDPGVQRILNQLREGTVANVILFARNIDSPAQLQELTKALHEAAGDKSPLFIAVDQEGGRIQRLKESNGFCTYKSAQEVANSLSPEEAYLYYSKTQLGLSDTGINLVLGPVVDLMHAPGGSSLNPVIGKLERAFSDDPEKVTTYARAFIKAFREHGIATALKHYPGHGLASGDSHKGFVDITQTHQRAELAPYYALIGSGDVDMIMSAHLTDQNCDPKNPISLSPTYMKKTLRDQGYQGVIITDDLFMGAIRQHYTFEEAIVAAIKASNDILILSVNAAALKGVMDEHAKMAQKGLDNRDFINEAYAAVITALDAGDLNLDDLKASANRVRKLKEARLS